jgi:DNA-binding NarL/FixJ family response regulator
MTVPLPTTENRLDTIMPNNASGILIADDEVLMSTALRKLLTHEGYYVECVETGWDAAKALQTGRFALLIVDIFMPGNDALDVLHSQEMQAARVPAIVITGHPSFETALDALRLSVVDYFVKPIPPQGFLTSVQRAMERSRALQTVREVEQQVGDVASVLQSLKGALEGSGLSRLGTHGASDNAVEEPTRVRLQAQDLSHLSRREREILQMIVDGESTNAAAARLGISVSTVRNHLKSIYRKLGVSSQVTLVRKLLM